MELINPILYVLVGAVLSFIVSAEITKWIEGPAGMPWYQIVIEVSLLFFAAILFMAGLFLMGKGTFLLIW